MRGVLSQLESTKIVFGCTLHVFALMWVQWVQRLPSWLRTRYCLPICLLLAFTHLGLGTLQPTASRPGGPSHTNRDATGRSVMTRIISTAIITMCTLQGSYASWKLLDFFCKISRLENIHVRTPSFHDSFLQWWNIFYYMWQWWTLQYGCYCHTLICRVSNCCLALYLHVAGDYDRVLENTFVVLESPGIHFGQDSGNHDFNMWVMSQDVQMSCLGWWGQCLVDERWVSRLGLEV